LPASSPSSSPSPSLSWMSGSLFFLAKGKSD
jgi:hypothetical protein